MVTMTGRFHKYASTRKGRVLHIVKAGIQTYCGREVSCEEPIFPIMAVICSVCKDCVAREAG